MTWNHRHEESFMAIPEDTVVKATAMDTETTVTDDDETALINSISSLSLLSSQATVYEQHSYNTSLLAASSRSQNKEAVFSYKLKPHERQCLGYLQFQAQVASLNQVPAELAMVSGKSIVYVVLDTPANHYGSNEGAAEDNLFAHPLLNEALESLFVPISVIPLDSTTDQNKRLAVAQVGFLDESGAAIVPSLVKSELSLAALLRAMVAALTIKQPSTTIPLYLLELVQETSPATSNTSSTATTITTTNVEAQPNEFLRPAWFGLPVERVKTLTEALQHQPGVRSYQLARHVDGDDSHVVVQMLYNAKETSYSAMVRLALTGAQSLSPSASSSLPPPNALATHVLCQSNDECMAARVEVAKLTQLWSATNGSNEMSDEDLPGLGSVQIEYIGACETLHLEPYHDLSALCETPLRLVPMSRRQAVQANDKIQCGRFDEAVRLLSPRQGLILLDATRKGTREFQDVSELPLLEAWITVSDRVEPVTRKKFRAADPEHWLTESA
jgi:hypothetical protein